MGPAGDGKTTLARLLAVNARAEFIALSAVLGGVKEIRAAVEQAQQQRAAGRPTAVFVDEVHRFNKAQQDAFLPHIENGTITFIGATTENPAFELNNALLSRVRVYALRPLPPAALRAVIDRALEALAARAPLTMQPALRDRLAEMADGDARRALNLLELAASLAPAGDVDAAVLTRAVEGSGVRRFDKGQDDFYDQISALHKAVRGSNPDAALYWYARMLDGGCDPSYLARRILRIARKIGNADPRALGIALTPGKRHADWVRPKVNSRSPRRWSTAPARRRATRSTSPSTAPRTGARPWFGRGARASAQRADQSRPRPGARPGLPLRSRRAGRACRRPDLFPGSPG